MKWNRWNDQMVSLLIELYPVETTAHTAAMLVMALVGLVTIYVKQRGGLHNKRRAKGIYVYKNLKRNS